MLLYKRLYSIMLACLIITGAALFAVYVKLENIDIGAEGQFRLVQETKQKQQQQTYQQGTAQQLLTVQENKVSTKAYFYGASLIASKSNNVVTYYHDDYLGSTRVQSDSGAKKVFASRAVPFGSDVFVSGSSLGSENSYKFTGQEQDDSLYYYGARYYDTRTGRFTQLDPMPSVSSPYAYTENNPLRFSDPDGASVWDTVKNNWRPVATGLAIGTVAYNAARGEGVFSGTAGKAAAGVLALDAAIASAGYVGDTRTWSRRSSIGSTQSSYRLSYDDIEPYVEFIRNSGVEGAEDVADALTTYAKQGLVFSSAYRTHSGQIIDELGPIPGITKVAPNANVKGYVMGGTVMNVVFYPGQKPGDLFFEDTLGYIAHEGKHLTRSRFSTALQQFFGPPYNSLPDFIERPAYDFQRKILLEYWERQEKQFIDTPPVSELDAMNNA